MEAYYRNPENQKKLTEILGFNWVISERDSVTSRSERERTNNNMNSLRTVDFENENSEISDEKEDQVFYSIEDLSEEEQEMEK